MPRLEASPAAGRPADPFDLPEVRKLEPCMDVTHGSRKGKQPTPQNKKLYTSRKRKLNSGFHQESDGESQTNIRSEIRAPAKRRRVLEEIANPAQPHSPTRRSSRLKERSVDHAEDLPSSAAELSSPRLVYPQRQPKESNTNLDRIQKDTPSRSDSRNQVDTRLGFGQTPSDSFTFQAIKLGPVDLAPSAKFKEPDTPVRPGLGAQEEDGRSRRMATPPARASARKLAPLSSLQLVGSAQLTEQTHSNDSPSKSSKVLSTSSVVRSLVSGQQPPSDDATVIIPERSARIVAPVELDSTKGANTNFTTKPNRKNERAPSESFATMTPEPTPNEMQSHAGQSEQTARAEPSETSSDVDNIMEDENMTVNEPAQDPALVSDAADHESFSTQVGVEVHEPEPLRDVTDPELKRLTSLPDDFVTASPHVIPDSFDLRIVKQMKTVIPGMTAVLDLASQTTAPAANDVRPEKAGDDLWYNSPAVLSGRGEQPRASFLQGFPSPAKRAPEAARLQPVLDQVTKVPLHTEQPQPAISSSSLTLDSSPKMVGMPQSAGASPAPAVSSADVANTENCSTSDKVAQKSSPALHETTGLSTIKATSTTNRVSFALDQVVEPAVLRPAHEEDVTSMARVLQKHHDKIGESLASNLDDRPKNSTHSPAHRSRIMRSRSQLQALQQGPQYRAPVQKESIPVELRTHFEPPDFNALRSPHDISSLTTDINRALDVSRSSNVGVYIASNECSPAQTTESHGRSPQKGKSNSKQNSASKDADEQPALRQPQDESSDSSDSESESDATTDDMTLVESSLKKQWLEQLKPHQRSVFDTLCEVAEVLTQDLVSKETRIDEFVRKYERQGSQLVQRLNRSQLLAMHGCEKAVNAIRDERQSTLEHALQELSHGDVNMRRRKHISGTSKGNIAAPTLAEALASELENFSS